MDRRETLRRLGAPQFRYQCSRCRRYHSGTYFGALKSDFSTCETCFHSLLREQARASAAALEQSRQLFEAGTYHLVTSHRGSSREYIEACERMRREMGLLSDT